MSKYIATILECAAKLIETKGWTQGVFARDANGEEVSLLDNNAECFCVIGALSHESLGCNYVDVRSALANYLGFSASVDIFDWNDDQNRTKEEVIKTLRDCAARLLEDQ